MAATSIPVIVPLPRPRRVINAASSDRPRHRVLRSRDGQRGPLFSVFAPLFKGMHTAIQGDALS
jgi:hypothetical protein